MERDAGPARPSGAGGPGAGLILVFMASNGIAAKNGLWPKMATIMDSGLAGVVLGVGWARVGWRVGERGRG